MKLRFLLLAALLGAAPGPAARADEALAATLEKLSKDQIAAFNREDLGATMGYAHSKSPSYAQTQTNLTAQFTNLDAKAEQVSFRYIGHDDEFAVARVKVKVTVPNSDEFQDNVVDTMAFFHQEGGAWKLWDVYVVGSEFVE